jgi:hypothetical protein
MKEIDIEEYLKERGLVAILFHIDEVTSQYKCTDEEAYDLLTEMRFNEYVNEVAYDTIDDLCEQYEYERKDL